MFTLELFNAISKGTNWSQVLGLELFFFLLFDLLLVTHVSCGRNLKHSARLIVNTSPLAEMLRTPAGVMSRTLDTYPGELSSMQHVRSF